MQRALIVVSMLVASSMAFAGKEDREMMKDEVMPAVKAAEAKVKSACGCAMKITVDESTVKTHNDMVPVVSMAEHVTEGAGAYCTDDASRKAICQMKTLVLGKAKEAEFTFRAGKGIATTDGQSTPSWDMIVHELDK